MFVPDANGGLKEVPFDSKRRVLSDAVARNLVRSANNIKRVFGGKDQDIEWGIMNGRIYIVQARPYIDKR
jgi:phosphoenolpyruvate synthase/pyruvate phosphate dikinase